MKQFNLFLALLTLPFLAKAQETVVDLSQGPDYEQEVYFNFETGQAENFDVDAWEIAFYRMDDFDFGERINDGLGIEVFEVSTDPEDWDSVTPNSITNDAPQYYNSDSIWEEGAFDQGGDPDNQFSFGWGEYNPSNHHIEGLSIFILQYPDGNYKKFMIEDFFGGYTFKYATWDESANDWINEETETLSNNEGDGKLFNYYNLTENESVTASVDLDDWDLVFQKYVTDLGSMMYPVQGALQSPNVQVAVNTDMEADTTDLDFFTDINTTGYDWKEFDGDTYVVDSDTYYFLKREDDKIYRFHFLSFEGADTGNFSLAYEDVTDDLSTEKFDENNAFSIYPNPTTNRIVNLLYESNISENATVEIFDMRGKKVKSLSLKPESFAQHKLDLSNLSSGTYLIKFSSGEYQTTKKLILN